MPRMIGNGLSRREREVLEVLHRIHKGSVGDVLAALEEPPSYSAVRTQLRILEAKGHVRHKEEGPRYVYVATQPRPQAAQDALRAVVDTFFGGNSEQAIHALATINRQGEPCEPSEQGDSQRYEADFEQQFEKIVERVKRLHQEQRRDAQQIEQRERMATALRNLFEFIRNQPGADQGQQAEV